MQSDIVQRLRAASQGMRSHYKVGAVELIPTHTMDEAAAAVIRDYGDRRDADAYQRGKLEGARLALEAAASRADLIIATGRTEFALGYDAGAEMAASAIRALDPAKIVGEG